MKTARRIILGAHLLGAALLSAGCADKEATAPVASTLVDLSRAKSFNATVVSTLEATNPKDRIATRRELTQKVKGKYRAGGFRGNIAPIGDPSAPYDPAVTPVLALSTDALWSDFDEEFTDSASGKVLRIVARGPGNGSPVDNVWVWVDGTPAVRMTSVWRPAVGGWTLYRQTLTGFGGGFEPVVRITSTVNSSTALYARNALFGTHFASLSGMALDNIACWLTPQEAHAAMVIQACYGKGAVFAGESFVLGVGTAFLVPAYPLLINPVVAGAYLVGWGLWTQSLYEFLECVQNLPQRRTRRPNHTEVTNEFGF